MHIDHVAIWTRDLEKVKDFYVRYFSCTAGALYVNPIKKFSSYFLSFQDGARIEIMNRDDINGEGKGEEPGLLILPLMPEAGRS